MKRQSIPAKILDEPDHLPSLSSLIKLIKTDEPDIKVFGLNSSSRAYLISSIIKELDRTTVVIASNLKDARALLGDVGFFWGEEEKFNLPIKDRKIYYYPPGGIFFPNGELPSQKTTDQRMEVLFRLLSARRSTIIVTTPLALAQRTTSKRDLSSYINYLTRGEEIDREELIGKLLKGDYRRVSLVEDKGEFSVRGGILDIFPPLYQNPLRIELFGDKIESIRIFDPATQRSRALLDEMVIIPSGESIPLSRSDSFFEYLPQNTILFVNDPSKINMSEDEKEITELFGRFQTISFEGLEMFFPLEEGEKRFRFNIETNENIRREIKSLKSTQGMLFPLIKRMNGWLDERINVSLVCPTPSEANRLLELLDGYPLKISRATGSFCSEEMKTEEPPSVKIWLGELSSGFRLPSEKVVFITEDEIFGEKIRKRGISKKWGGYLVSSLGDLKLNDFVVHAEFGIGVYRRLKRLALDGKGIEKDFLLLEYLGGDKLYLPVERLNVVQKYIGAPGYTPKLDKLGGSSWNRVKKRVRESIKEMAEELLKIYATRRVREGFAFSKADNYYKEFEATFEYEETEDQLKAINDVLADMENPKSMDRLVCGDVGYGKTEVAMRASFKAAMDGKQVVVIAPTTILADQHYKTFISRLKEYPVNIEVLSRFKTRKEQKKIIDHLKEGKIDIIIGTHRLLQSDVAFKNLGLMIVDEEQRFGVSHKEKLKKLRSTVDVLTLTATPIPRTLNMSLMGIWDLSIIETPPKDRLSIKTYISRFNENTIREAILKEIRRGGQVFFVHNRVKSVESIGRFLKRLVPEARFAIAHGRLKARQLERVMLDFIRGGYDVLVCTSIIESGLDVPSANTIIINQADKFGLADIYQLRGRVGRSREQAYAYLLISKGKILTDDSKKRLKALQEFSELGSGFNLAIKDLEIRGAGNILGKSQSGHIAAVGYEMYLDLMEKAIKELRGEKVEKEIEPEIDLRISAFLPESYIPDTNQRLIIYKKLSSSITEKEVSDIEGEIIDLYGDPPPQAENLLKIIKIKNFLKKLKVKRLDFNGREIVLSLDGETGILPERIVKLISQDQKRFTFTPDLKLFFLPKDRSRDGILRETGNLLQELSEVNRG